MSLLHKIKLFFVLLGFITSISVYAQTDQDKELARQFIDIAEEIMNETQAMDQARESYVQAATFDPTNVKANFLAGEFHLMTIDKDQSVQYFLRVKDLDPDYRFDIDFKIAQSYQYGLNFEKAIEYYELYKKRVADNPRYSGRDFVAVNQVDTKIEQCKNAISFRANPSPVRIQNVGGRINSEFDDFAPVLDENEEFIVFTTRRRDDNLNENVEDDNKPFEDIFYSRKKNGDWDYARNIGRSINTKSHDSNLAISADGNTLFLYKVRNNGDIYVTEREQDTIWSEPMSISENINSQSFKESSVSLSPNGKTLFFSSDRPGGNGSFDIYYATMRDNGTWDAPRNLGDVVNTAFSEDGPWMDYDGKTLYFSSEAHNGMGGFDIFKTVYDSATEAWSQPKNLGYPINTPDDDIYFVMTKDGKTGYYASVREDGYGFLDIYKITFEEDIEDPEEEVAEEAQFEEEEETQPVTVTVSVLGEGGTPLDATVGFKNIETNSEPGLSKPEVGTFVFTLQNEEAAAYRLSVESSGYVYETIDLTVPAMTTEPQNITRRIQMRKPVVNTRKVLKNIYFDFNKATFQKESFEELNRLYQMMSENGNMKIEISGHTDNIGSKTYNKQLSQKRANAVKNFLTGKGIDARRIEAIGFGEEKPLASNDDEKEGRELNRRVEFKVIK